MEVIGSAPTSRTGTRWKRPRRRPAPGAAPRDRTGRATNDNVEDNKFHSKAYRKGGITCGTVCVSYVMHCSRARGRWRVARRTPTPDRGLETRFFPRSNHDMSRCSRRRFHNEFRSAHPTSLSQRHAKARRTRRFRETSIVNMLNMIPGGMRECCCWWQKDASRPSHASWETAPRARRQLSAACA